MPGQRVLVEGVVTAWEYGKPYGAVTVAFPTATDPSHLLDGVEAVVPQAVVFTEEDVAWTYPGVDVANDYTAAEGFYPEENE